MNTLTLFDALKLIGDHRAQEILEQLEELHLQSPEDVPTNYILAHALEMCGLKSRAEYVWNNVSPLQPEQQAPKKTELSDEVNSFIHTSGIQIELNRIVEGDKLDEIQQLILQLDAADRTTFDEELLAGDTSLGEFSEESYDDPITETFARILVTQKKYSEASDVYRSLSEQNPAEKERLLAEAKRLEDLAKQEADS